MSTIVFPRQQEENQSFESARLIPGSSIPFTKNRRKPPRGVTGTAPEFGSLAFPAEPLNDGAPVAVLPSILPRPLQRRLGLRWARAMALDCSIITTNCLVLGGLGLVVDRLVPGLRLVHDDINPLAWLLGMSVVQAALLTLIAYVEGLHCDGLDASGQRRAVAKAVFWTTLLLSLSYSLHGLWWTPLLICATGILDFGFLSLWRSWAESRHTQVAEKADSRNVLIVGAGNAGRRIASYIEGHPSTGRVLRGFLDDERPLGHGIMGRVGELRKVARRKFIDEIILATPRNSETTRWVLEESRQLHLDVEIVPDLFGYSPVEPEIARVGSVPLICLHAECLPAAGLFAKRILDICGAALALGFAAPVMAVIAFLIKLDSKGPVLYSAERVGRKGNVFRCHKFRTMVCDADVLKAALRDQNERKGPCFKLSRDPRITRVGRYLRRFSLDELPQFWNVLKGEMSLVGPRPHPVDDVAGYEVGHLARLDVTPGITGLWQVSARRDPSFVRGLELDRDYIRNWSFWLDIQILCRTVGAVVSGSGQ